MKATRTFVTADADVTCWSCHTDARLGFEAHPNETRLLLHGFCRFLCEAAAQNLPF